MVRLGSVMGAKEPSRRLQRHTQMSVGSPVLCFLQGKEMDRVMVAWAPLISWAVAIFLAFYGKLSYQQGSTGEQKTRFLELFPGQNTRKGRAITELCNCMVRSYLSHIWVGIFRVNAPVLLHILEGIGHVSPSTAIILRNTIHQVLGTQI